jgi:hypothetical protein
MGDSLKGASAVMRGVRWAVEALKENSSRLPIYQENPRYAVTDNVTWETRCDDKVTFFVFFFAQDPCCAFYLLLDGSFVPPS